MRVKLSDVTKYLKGTQINGDDLIENGEYIYLNGGINPSGRWNAANVKGNTVTISEGGNSSGYVNYVTEPFWCGAHCYYLFDGPKNTKYLYYALKSQQERLFDIRSGACMPNIKKSDLGKFEFEFDTDEQKQSKIVSVLSKIEVVIGERKRELELLDDLIRARFVEMFGNPVSNPKGWKRVTIDECVDSIENGKSFVCDSMARIGEEPAILKLSAATYGVYKPEENKAIINESDFIESAEVHSGDLLFTRKNTPELVGMATYVFMTPKKLMMPDLIFRINTKQNCRKIYLWKLINHELFRSQIQNLASGSAKSMSNISKERLGKLHICLPPLDLQIKFEEFVIQINKSKVAAINTRHYSVKIY